MNRTVKVTSDGSKTLHVNSLDETYHSHHGALQEAKHVFIKNGLNLLNKSEINILELGFGTGLNALVTIDEFLKNDDLKKVNYCTVEKYPINGEEVDLLNYHELFSGSKFKMINEKMHAAEWNKSVEILPNFFLHKIKDDFFNISNMDLPEIDLVYFDCFGARVQPDLWEDELVQQVCSTMGNSSLLTTYSSKGSFRRLLEAQQLQVEKKPGPPGKREMMIAWKLQPSKQTEI